MSGTATKSGTGAGAVLSISTAAVTSPANPPAAIVSPIAILQLKDFTMPSQKWAYDDITCTSSPSVGVGVIKESLATLVDAGEFSATGVFLPSDPGQVAVQAAFTTGAVYAFTVQLQKLPGQTTTGNLYLFDGYVQENPLPSNISAEKAVTVKINLKLNSVIVVTQGS